MKRVSFVISTYNRREVLLSTLQRILDCGLSAESFEILVIDNASSDGTAQAIVEQFSDVRVFPVIQNLGPCAKNIGIENALGEYVVFLDDDSCPVPGAIERMIQHFEADLNLGAAVFTVTLPDGSRECCAYPSVFIGCGTGFRREALVEVGGLPTDFFMAAEEYDLSLRLLDSWWNIRTFDDLHVTHLKTPGARAAWRLMRLDVRNNLLILTRYMPWRWVLPMARDWMMRYYRIAKKKGRRSAFFAGLIQGIVRAILPGKRRPVQHAVFEHFTKMRRIEREMQSLKKRLNLQTVLFIDYGKNILPYWLAAKKCGLRVVAVADNQLAGTGMYRGVPIVTDEVAQSMQFDAAIISNLSPVHAAARARTWRGLCHRPIIDLFEAPQQMSEQTMLAA